MLRRLLCLLLVLGAADAAAQPAAVTPAAPGEEGAAATSPTDAPASDSETLLAQAGGDEEDRRTSSKKAREAAMKKLAEQYPSKGEASFNADGGSDGGATNLPPPLPGSDAALLRFEHHGYFRLRTDLLWNLDLDTRGTSPIPPPLDSSERNGSTNQGGRDDDETLTSANMRFRYAPTLHIKEHLRLHVMLDILDNIVLGSTPDGIRGARPDVAIPGLTGSTESPQSDNIGKEAIEVRAAYGEIIWTIGALRAGRMPNHWGMGMLFDGGGVPDVSRLSTEPNGRVWDCLDCNFGSYIDRIELEVRDPIGDLFFVSFAWDMPSTGLSTYQSGSGGTFGGQSYGQPFDLDPADDVTQFTMAIYDKPKSGEKIKERLHDLDHHEPVLDWGLRVVYRSQDEGLDWINGAATPGDYTGIDTGDPASGSNNVALVPRDMLVVIPDLWARFFYQFGSKRYLRLEGEFAALIGHLDTEQGGESTNREIQQFGFAFESELRYDDVFVGFNTGLATGDDSYGFGYLDVDKVNQPDLRTGQQATSMNAFQFHRNYMVDLIMFRELVGGITNAVYINPNVAYNIEVELARERTLVGARLDLISAFALNKESTPGQSTWYGFESDLRIYYEEPNDYRLEVATGLFVPGGVWDRTPGTLLLPQLEGIYELSPNDIDSGRDPGIAWTLQANFWWLF